LKNYDTMRELFANQLKESYQIPYELKKIIDNHRNTYLGKVLLHNIKKDIKIVAIITYLYKHVLYKIGDYTMVVCKDPNLRGFLVNSFKPTDNAKYIDHPLYIDKINGISDLFDRNNGARTDIKLIYSDGENFGIHEYEYDPRDEIEQQEYVD